MATVILPITNDPWGDMTVRLDGQDYRFEWRWNDRAQAFFYALYDSEDNPLVTGRKLVVSWPLCYRDRNPKMPPGTLYAYDTSGREMGPTLDDLGTRVLLYYDEASA